MKTKDSLVDERVDTSELLEARHPSAHNRPLDVTLAERIPPLLRLLHKRLPHARAVTKLIAIQARMPQRRDLLVHGDLGEDGEVLGLDARVVLGEGSQAGEGGEALVVALLHGEPAGGVGEEPGAEEEDDAGDELEAEGKAPGEARINVTSAEGEPVGDDLDDSQCDCRAMRGR